MSRPTRHLARPSSRPALVDETRRSAASLLRRGVWVLTAALLSACAAEEVATGCKVDGDCNRGFTCKTEIGECRCVTDDACGAGQYCNGFGVCQARPPCLGNKDCENLVGPGYLCDSSDATGGVCIPGQQCGSSVHCAFNQYCPPPTAQNPTAVRTCQPGCRHTGDCQLGFVCVAGQCTDGAIAGSCNLCPASPDPDGTYCSYGDRCVGGECQDHPIKADLCERCDGASDCPTAAVCLIDREEEDANYCSPTCNFDADCPNGYGGCGPVVRVPGGCNPLLTQTCPGGGRCIGGAEADSGYCECTSDDDCNPYGDYAGVCFLGSCGWGCNTDADCSGYTCQGGAFGGSCQLPACNNDDQCICVQGRCFGTGDPCSVAADCLSTCVDGVCPTNFKVCGKEAGFTCDDLRTGDAACESL